MLVNAKKRETLNRILNFQLTLDRENHLPLITQDWPIDLVREVKIPHICTGNYITMQSLVPVFKLKSTEKTVRARENSTRLKSVAFMFVNSTSSNHSSATCSRAAKNRYQQTRNCKNWTNFWHFNAAFSISYHRTLPKKNGLKKNDIFQHLTRKTTHVQTSQKRKIYLFPAGC